MEKERGKLNEKTKNMIFMIVGIVILIGVGIWYYMYWEGNTYFSTENAKVTAKLYSIVPLSAGRLDRLTVEEGSIVKANEVIGRVENSSYLKSPIDGEIVKVNSTVNSLVSPTSAVAVVADTSNIYVQANIEETNIVRVKEGQDVTVTIDAYPGKKFNGRVLEIDKATQGALTNSALSFSTSGTYTKVVQLIPVKIALEDSVNLDGLIGVNSTVRIRLR